MIETLTTKNQVDTAQVYKAGKLPHMYIREGDKQSVLSVCLSVSLSSERV